LIPKGLIIATSIGIIAGIVFGLIFVDFKSINQLEFVEGSSVSIVTEKLDFNKGDEIQIRIVNSGTTTLTFSDASYGLKITQLDTIEIYSPIAAQVISVLEPKQEITFVWDQIKNNGDSVNQGTYRILTKAIDENRDEIKRSITINIFK